MDLDKARALEKEAEQHGGHCSNCHQTIKIYRYGISTSMVRVLKTMAKATDKNSGRAIDVDKLDLRHSDRTQLTKMRFHGLVAKVKDDGVQIPRHWLITRKGWAFLGNELIPAKVLVYNNQVLGHEDGTTEIKRVSGEADDYDAIPVTEPQARVLHDVRTPVKQMTMQAEWLGYSSTNLVKGQVYTILVDRLQVGRPVYVTIKEILQTEPMKFNDIAAFGRSWKVTK